MAIGHRIFLAKLSIFTKNEKYFAPPKSLLILLFGCHDYYFAFHFFFKNNSKNNFLLET